MSVTAPLVELRGLSVEFRVSARDWIGRSQTLRAVDGASFSIDRGETLALVGESGCGKTTLGRALLRLVEPSAGSIVFDGEDVTRLSGRGLQRFRRQAQMVFQDPYASLNSRMSVRDLISEPLRAHGVGDRRARAARVDELLDLVGLPRDAANAYPHGFSGGQRQRIGIARALALAPTFLIADEPVSALDVSIQAQVVNLLADLQAELGLTTLFIAHDLAVVRHISTRVAVMYLGAIVELGSRDALFERPSHPYTRALLSAVPIPDPVRERRRRRIVLSGDVPSPTELPSGCRFRTRCPLAADVCAEQPPPLVEHEGGRLVACHFAGRPIESADLNA